MSKKILCINKELSELAYLGQYKKGIVTVEKYLKFNSEDANKLLSRKSFFLYHNAADLLYNKKYQKVRKYQNFLMSNFNL